MITNGQSNDPKEIDGKTESNCQSQASGEQCVCGLAGVPARRIVGNHFAYVYSSPEGFWHDQDEHECVTLLRGSAVLDFTANPTVVACVRATTFSSRHIKSTALSRPPQKNRPYGSPYSSMAAFPPKSNLSNRKKLFDNLPCTQV